MLYAGYSPSGTLTALQKQMLILTAECFSSLDVETIAIFATDETQNLNQSYLFSNNLKVLSRRNKGYDFGSWSFALSSVNLSDYSHIIFMNDSIVGPLYDLRPLINTIVNDNHDYLGITESEQIAPHFQSYCFALSTRALRTMEISQIFEADKMAKIDISERDYAISKREVPILSKIHNLGLSSRVIWKAGTLTSVANNPSLDGWERLIGSGFPFVKRSLLSDQNNRKKLLEILVVLDKQQNLDIVDLI
jgi:lipopolysaccharide biosynthesis protein